MDNLVALVTGANKGIAKEIARQLADAGLSVYVGSRDAARGQRAVEEIRGDTSLLVVDVTDDASIADERRTAVQILETIGMEVHADWPHRELRAAVGTAIY